MTLWGILERAADAHGARPAACAGPVAGRRPFSYAELAARARGLAGCLARRGVEPGDRVAILSENSLFFLEAYFAAAGAGAILTPLNDRLAEREQRAVLAGAGPRVLLAGAARADAARELAGGTLDLLVSGEEEGEPGSAFAPRAAAQDDPAQLYFTSGTTGRPKGVVLTHGNVAVHARNAVSELGLGPADVWGHVAPMFHLADAWAVFAVTLAGGAHVFAPRFREDEVLALFERERVSATNLVPTMLNRLLRSPACERFDPSALRLLLSGGAPIAPALVRDLVARFRCEYAQTYGMTETSPFLTVSLPDREQRARPPEALLRLRARTGRPFRGVEVEVVDEAGRPVPHDDRTVGEIRARGPSVSPGYWNAPEETAAAYRDGWLYTGDLAVVDADGFLQIVDRRKDVILTGGETVYSTEVENALAEHPEVFEAAVVAIPDETWGERVHAVVVLRPGAAAGAGELRDFVRARLAGYKVPRSVELAPDLPRTGSGKIAKAALRARSSSPGRDSRDSPVS